MKVIKAVCRPWAKDATHQILVRSVHKCGREGSKFNNMCLAFTYPGTRYVYGYFLVVISPLVIRYVW